MAVGLLLLSTMDAGRARSARPASHAVLGMGLGLVMQVLVMAVQNAVDYRDLGVATSGATLFRLIGGSMGTAAFGAIFSNRLTSELRGAVAGAATRQQGRLSPAQLHHLPAAARGAYVHAFTNALSDVFLVAAGVAVIGFALALALPDQELRDTVEAAGPQETFATPRSPDSVAEIERALSVLARRDVRRRLYERLAQEAGIDLPPLEAWTLARINEGGGPQVDELARRIDVEPERVSAAAESLVERGLVAATNGWYEPTPEGTELIDRLVTLRRERLAERLTDCTPEQQEQFAHVLNRLARDLLSEKPRAEAPTA